MTYRVPIDPVALRQIDQFATYLRDYSEDFAIEQIERLDRILRLNLGESPLTWSYFPLTGADAPLQPRDRVGRLRRRASAAAIAAMAMEVMMSRVGVRSCF
jgi:hypothetical protein